MSSSMDIVQEFSSHSGCTFIKQVTSVYYLITCPESNDKMNIEEIADQFKDKIKSIEYQDLHKNYPRTADPMWKDMWNLKNETQPSMNVLEAWNRGYNGSGVNIAVIDDGIQMDHPDLQRNIDVVNSYDYIGNDTDPFPANISDDHGTKVAGIVAAEANNDECIVGIAFNSTIIGIRLLGDDGVTDVTEALALTHNMQDVDIYVNAWGPADRYGYSTPGSVTYSAFLDGVSSGRNGKGNIFLWAAGNGGISDNCNADGYVNQIFTIPITSVGADGDAASYSEVCAPVFAATYSGTTQEYNLTSTTTESKCVDGLIGTSFSVPQAAGIIALVIQANPSLTWRDMQHLIAETSKKHNLQNLQGGYSSWQRNGAGYNVSQILGFGLMDADAMVAKAKTWVSVPEQIICATGKFSIERSTGLSSGVLSKKEITTQNCAINTIEHVEVFANFTYSSNRGDVLLYLDSPAGTRSHLMTHRPADSAKYPSAGSLRWYYSSVHFWGETVDGTWILSIDSNNRSSVQVTLHSWRLYFYGFYKDNSGGTTSTTETSTSVDKESKTSLNTITIAVIATVGALAIIIIFFVLVRKYCSDRSTPMGGRVAPITA
ncbi:furin-like protease kpc-1 [Saccostrea echinata]|uniref:furin-like protease kpc-1 n=1 Tax=Saccostrea echinata TaxID=191078 RepID=UPI002A83E8D0|nr:furin-like protease kpc-1 [Saccostrea echinata]